MITKFCLILFQLISTPFDTDIGKAVKKSESFDDDQERPWGSKPGTPGDEIKNKIDGVCKFDCFYFS